MPFILMPATFLLLLFPDGRLLSRRWRPVAWCAAVGMAGSFVASGLHPGRIPDFPQIVNPIGGGSVRWSICSRGSRCFALVIGVVGSSASLIVRFRRSRGEQRQQMKWLALAGAVVAVTVPIAVVTLRRDRRDGCERRGSCSSVLGLPAATGVAILRYRLYDIDVVINRTLVYGALTAIAGRRLPRQRAAAAARAEPVHRGVRARGRRLDPRGRGALPPGSRSHPGGGRPALLPAQVRRRADARALRRAAARRGRPRRARQRAARESCRTRCNPLTSRCGCGRLRRGDERSRRAGVGDGHGPVRRHPRLHDLCGPRDRARGGRLPERVLRRGRADPDGARRAREQAAG